VVVRGRSAGRGHRDVVGEGRLTSPLFIVYLRYTMNTTALSRTRRRQRFAASERGLSVWAKALGHPARLAILRFLANRRTCFCGQIVDELPLAQSTVSQHLRELKDAGLIQGTVEGTRTCYCLDPQTIQRMDEALGELLARLRPPVEQGGTACDSQRTAARSSAGPPAPQPRTRKPSAGNKH